MFSDINAFIDFYKIYLCGSEEECSIFQVEIYAVAKTTELSLNEIYITETYLHFHRHFHEQHNTTLYWVRLAIGSFLAINKLTD